MFWFVFYVCSWNGGFLDFLEGIFVFLRLVEWLMWKVKKLCLDKENIGSWRSFLLNFEGVERMVIIGILIVD